MRTEQEDLETFEEQVQRLLKEFNFLAGAEPSKEPNTLDETYNGSHAGK